MACNGAYTMGYIIWYTLKYIINDKARHIQMHIIRNAVTLIKAHIIRHVSYTGAYNWASNIV